MRFTQEISIFNPHAIEFAVLETRTQITQTAEAIRLEAAQTLARYSTTVQMNAAIEVSASGVLTTVNRTLQDYSTTEQMNTAIQTSASGIRVEINNTLSSYSTTSQMNTAIQASASGVLSTVSSTYATKTTTNSLQSQINQSAHTISLSVSGTAGKSSSAGITVTLKDKNGNVISTGSGDVYIDGNVIFSSQLTDGTTTISGSNIKTGTINASLVSVTNINASNITSGTLSGRTILQTVSGAEQGGISGNESDGQQAKIENGIVTCGELAVKGRAATISIVPEGWDGRGGYGLYCTGHFSTEGCLWTNGGIGDADIICRGNAFANNFIQSSDRRLKTDIVPLDDDAAGDVIYNLKPVTFRLKEQTNEKRHGFIAQDVQTLIADDWGIVSESDVKLIDGKPTLALNYTELIADIVSVLQTQNRRISDLESRLLN